MTVGLAYIVIGITIKAFDALNVLLSVDSLDYGRKLILPFVNNFLHNHFKEYIVINYYSPESIILWTHFPPGL